MSFWLRVTMTGLASAAAAAGLWLGAAELGGGQGARAAAAIGATVLVTLGAVWVSRAPSKVIDAGVLPGARGAETVYGEPYQSSGLRLQDNQDRNMLPPIPAFVFRSPMLWEGLLLTGLFSLPVLSGVVSIAYGIASQSSRVAGFIFVGGFLVLGGLFLLFIMFKFSEEVRDVIKLSQRLVIDASGIRYRWSRKRRFSCPWNNVLQLKVQSGAYAGSHLVSVVSDGTRKREVVLCDVGSWVTADEIRQAIASFEPSLLGPGL